MWTSSIAAAMGLSMLASHLFPDAGVGANVIILIGMAVGVDYSLFYLKREREERARSGGRLGPQALADRRADQRLELTWSLVRADLEQRLRVSDAVAAIRVSRVSSTSQSGNPRKSIVSTPRTRAAARCSR